MKKILLSVLLLFLLSCGQDTASFAGQVGVGGSNNIPVHSHINASDGGKLSLANSFNTSIVSTTTNSISLGNVTSGDIYMVACQAYINYTSLPIVAMGLISKTGTAGLDIGSNVIFGIPPSALNHSSNAVMIFIRVVTSGTLTIKCDIIATGGTGLEYINTMEISSIFKQ